MTVFVSKQPRDFADGGALVCSSDHSSGLIKVIWIDCVQPVTGAYITLQAGVVGPPERVYADMVQELGVCEIEVYGKGMSVLLSTS